MSYKYWKAVPFSVLTGKTMKSVVNVGDEIQFTTEDGVLYRMYHEQDCCENVGIEDITGDLADLIGTPILVAEERDGDWPAKEGTSSYYSYTWTFYCIRTIRGSVDIRWYGTSNGYYSERVDLRVQEEVQ